MRRASRRDENETAIVAALEAVGCSVERISAKGIPDLLVGYRGSTLILEVIGDAKAKKYRATGGLTPDQVAFKARWRGQWASARTSVEALIAVGVASVPK